MTLTSMHRLAALDAQPAPLINFLVDKHGHGEVAPALVGRNLVVTFEKQLLNMIGNLA